MKRRALLKYLIQYNCHVVEQGGSHTAVMNFSNGKKSYVPRHSEIKHGTVRAICKQLDVPPPF